MELSKGLPVVAAVVVVVYYAVARNWPGMLACLLFLGSTLAPPAKTNALATLYLVPCGLACAGAVYFSADPPLCAVCVLSAVIFGYLALPKSK